MKEKWSRFLEKCRAVAKKAGARGAIAVCAVLIIGGAVALNFILADKEKPNRLMVDLSKPADDDAVRTSEPQDEELNAGDAIDTFASITLERRQARDEALEVLKTVADSETALAEAKNAAGVEISRIASGMEREANIEALMQSRGFMPCVAVLSDTGCSVIVGTEGLMQSDVAQISEIVWEQAGISPENLRIIEKKP